MDQQQRRARLARRHLLGGGAGSALEVTRAVVALHATDPATVFLSVMARAPDLDVATITGELYEQRQLVRMMAMRRTLFVLPVEAASAFHHGVSRDVAATMRRRLLKDLATGPTDPALPADLERWLGQVEDQVVAFVAAEGPVDGATIAKAVPDLRTALLPRTTKAYDVRRAVTSNVLALMGTDGRLVRGRPAGSWTSRRHTWEAASSWYPGGLAVRDPDEARAEVLASYLRGFGPVSVTDMAWWTGWALGVTRSALSRLSTAEVAPGLLVLAEDADPVAPPRPAAALLPALDPTPMGWKERAWFLPEDSSLLYDRFGNVGPTVWWDGEVVGYWAVRGDGEVVTALLSDRGKAAADAVAAEAARLSSRLAGSPVVPSFRTPGEKQLSSS